MTLLKLIEAEIEFCTEYCNNPESIHVFPTAQRFEHLLRWKEYLAVTGQTTTPNIDPPEGPSDAIVKEREH
jgi:hypothetical protein